MLHGSRIRSRNEPTWLSLLGKTHWPHRSGPEQRKEGPWLPSGSRRLGEESHIRPRLCCDRSRSARTLEPPIVEFKVRLKGSKIKRDIAFFLRLDPRVVVLAGFSKVSDDPFYVLRGSLFSRPVKSLKNRVTHGKGIQWVAGSRAQFLSVSSFNPPTVYRP